MGKKRGPDQQRREKKGGRELDEEHDDLIGTGDASSHMVLLHPPGGAYIYRLSIQTHGSTVPAKPQLTLLLLMTLVMGHNDSVPPSTELSGKIVTANASLMSGVALE